RLPPPDAGRPLPAGRDHLRPDRPAPGADPVLCGGAAAARRPRPRGGGHGPRRGPAPGGPGRRRTAAAAGAGRARGRVDGLRERARPVPRRRPLLGLPLRLHRLQPAGRPDPSGAQRRPPARRRLVGRQPAAGRGLPRPAAPVAAAQAEVGAGLRGDDAAAAGFRRHAVPQPGLPLRRPAPAVPDRGHRRRPGPPSRAGARPPRRRPAHRLQPLRLLPVRPPEHRDPDQGRSVAERGPGGAGPRPAGRRGGGGPDPRRPPGPPGRAPHVPLPVLRREAAGPAHGQGARGRRRHRRRHRRRDRDRSGRARLAGHPRRVHVVALRPRLPPRRPLRRRAGLPPVRHLRAPVASAVVIVPAQGTPEPPPSGGRRLLSLDRRSLALGIGLAMAVFLAAWYRHQTFRSGSLDLAVYDQAVWKLAHFRAPDLSTIGWNAFADHFSPALLLFAPLYRLAATPLWLLASQAVALGVGFLAVGPLLDTVGVTGRWRGAFRFAYLASPLLWNAALYDFHTT